jgi:hypothetical protein
MNRLTKKLSLLGATVAVTSALSLVGGSSAKAATVTTTAYSGSGSVIANQFGYTGSLAQEFTVTAPVTIDLLGAFDPGDIAIPSGVSITVSLYSTSGLVATATLTSASNTTLVNNFLYTSIASTNLGDGSYEIVASGFGQSPYGDYNSTISSPSGAITENTSVGGGNITYGDSYYGSITSYGSGTDAPGVVFGAGSFANVIPAVPEPLSVGGTVIAAGLGIWLKKKRASAAQ